MVLPLRLTVAAMALVVGCADKPAPQSEPPPDGAAVVEAEPDGGPAIEPSSYDESLEIDGVQLGLSAKDCVLTAEGSAGRLQHRFAFPAACAFSRDASGAVRIVETDTGKAVMVESSRPLEQDCETALRVVVITSQGPRVSKAAQRVAMCAPFEWDAMMFHVLASDPVELGTPSVDP